MLSGQIQPIEIHSIEEFISCVKRDSQGWPHVWFRGEPTVETPLLPSLYRSKYNENKLLQLFRMRAPIFNGLQTPDRDAIDQWLFLAQHVGLPTRLLDWTESALIALYFALRAAREEEKKQNSDGGETIPAMVWMLNPIALNNISANNKSGGEDEFPLTWFSQRKDVLTNVSAILTILYGLAAEPHELKNRVDGTVRTLTRVDIGSENIMGAWEADSCGTEFPVAVLPTNIHPRMSVQRSCFTVQGKCKDPLSVQLHGRNPTILQSYKINPKGTQEMLDDLRTLGISHSTIFPDLDGLATELRDICC